MRYIVRQGKGSSGWMEFATIGEVCEHIASLSPGMVRFWRGSELHTDSFTGNRRFSIYVRFGSYRAPMRYPSPVLKLNSAEASQVEQACQVEPWRYSSKPDYVRPMVGVYREAFKVLHSGGMVRMERWTGRTLDLAGFRAEFIRALNRRINAKVCDRPRGRKDCQEYQIALYRDSRRVRDCLARRVIVRQFETAEARQRFSHLLTTEND